MVLEERHEKIISPFSAIEGLIQNSIAKVPGFPSVPKIVPGLPLSVIPFPFPRLKPQKCPITEFSMGSMSFLITV